MFNSKKRVVNTYEIPVQCNNCGTVGVLLAPKGELKDSAVKEDVCSNCGCKTLKMISEQEYYKKKPQKSSGGGLFEGLF